MCLTIVGLASAGPAYTGYNNQQTPYNTPKKFTLQLSSHRDNKPAQTLRQNNDIHDDGHYEYSYETSNGISAHESGLAGRSVEGAAHWTAPDGSPINLSYTADENGYHPVGNAIPVAPPVPEAIARALIWIQQHPYDESKARSVNKAGAYRQVAPVHHAAPSYHNVPVKPVYKNVPVQPVYKTQPIQPAYRPVNHQQQNQRNQYRKY